jgi:MFS family permease
LPSAWRAAKLGDNLAAVVCLCGAWRFGLASLLCGMAGNIEQLLAARIVQVPARR